MRFAAKVDANQKEIVAALRKYGYTVQSLAAIGKGCPDLLICSPAGRLTLVEVKIPGEDLNTMQREWHAKWNGEVLVLRSLEDIRQQLVLR